jgi:hypothetical protein
VRWGLWGIVFAFLRAPVHRWLVRRPKGRVGLPAGIIALQVPVLRAGPLFWRWLQVWYEPVSFGYSGPSDPPGDTV